MTKVTEFFRTFCTNYCLKQKWCWHITGIDWYWILFSQQIKTSHYIFCSWWGGNEWQTFSRTSAVKWGKLLLTLSPGSPGEPGGPCNPGVPGRPWDHTDRDTHALSILYPKLLLTSIPTAVSQTIYLPNKSIEASKRNKPQNKIPPQLFYFRHTRTHGDRNIHSFMNKYTFWLCPPRQALLAIRLMLFP